MMTPFISWWQQLQTNGNESLAVKEFWQHSSLQNYFNQWRIFGAWTTCLRSCHNRQGFIPNSSKSEHVYVRTLPDVGVAHIHTANLLLLPFALNANSALSPCVSNYDTFNNNNNTHLRITRLTYCEPPGGNVEFDLQQLKCVRTHHWIKIKLIISVIQTQVLSCYN